MKVPCTDMELERRFVATKLIGRDWMGGFTLSPSDLCSPRLREIYSAALYLDSNEENWSIDSIITFLESEQKLEMVGKSYLMDVYTATDLVVTDIKPMVDRLKLLAKARRKREVLQSALKALEDSDYDHADKCIVELADSLSIGTDSKIYSSYELSQITKKSIESMKGGKKVIIPTGWKYLDNAIGGLLPGTMFTIAGYSSTGKSQIAQCLGKNIDNYGYPVGIISVEDAPLLSGTRLVASVTGKLSSRNLITGEYSDDRINNIISIIEESEDTFRNMHLETAHCTEATPSDVIECATKLIREYGCKVVILDYLQRVRVDLRIARYDKTISDIAKHLKGICARNGASLVLLSQLTRPREGNIYKRPHPNQLKESGDLENESEVIIMLWDDPPDKTRPHTRFWIPKVKWGGAGLTGILIRDRVTGMIIDFGEWIDDKGSEETTKRNGNFRYQSHYETRTDTD